MLTLRKIDEDYFIECSTKQGQQLSYSFNQDQLTEKSIAHLKQLPVFKNAKSTFALNRKQDEAFTDVLHKLQQEKDSDYVFSFQLQKTYLFELIHLITKLHLSTLPLFE